MGKSTFVWVLTVPAFEIREETTSTTVKNSFLEALAVTGFSGTATRTQIIR